MPLQAATKEGKARNASLKKKKSLPETDVAIEKITSFNRKHIFIHGCFFMVMLIFEGCTLPETNSFAPYAVGLVQMSFLLGFGLFSGATLQVVSREGKPTVTSHLG